MDWDKIKKGLKDVTEKSAELAGEGMEIAKEKYMERREEKKESKKELKQRLKEMDKQGIPYCPKCYSSSININKQGFGAGKAIVGGAINPIGLAAGFIGKNKLECTCLNCGHKWKPGKK
ncbi:hypothetical protein H1057_19575 [Clostridium sporogenes]|uniref:hypothetical protein n=1 Tax=Clostridium sporogenes TaxID=1509 RepID=UPI0015EEA412|nr:hypothetical protein [Clostridium sporogenes]MBA4510207.1 hypothetical protein [Clostridium sporogenes]